MRTSWLLTDWVVVVLKCQSLLKLVFIYPRLLAMIWSQEYCWWTGCKLFASLTLILCPSKFLLPCQQIRNNGLSQSSPANQIASFAKSQNITHIKHDKSDYQTRSFKQHIPAIPPSFCDVIWLRVEQGPNRSPLLHGKCLRHYAPRKRPLALVPGTKKRRSVAAPHGLGYAWLTFSMESWFQSHTDDMVHIQNHQTYPINKEKIVSSFSLEQQVKLPSTPSLS